MSPSHCPCCAWADPHAVSSAALPGHTVYYGDFKEERRGPQRRASGCKSLQRDSAAHTTLNAMASPSRPCSRTGMPVSSQEGSKGQAGPLPRAAQGAGCSWGSAGTCAHSFLLLLGLPTRHIPLQQTWIFHARWVFTQPVPKHRVPSNFKLLQQ